MGLHVRVSARLGVETENGRPVDLAESATERAKLDTTRGWFEMLSRAQLPRLLLAAGSVLRDTPKTCVFSDRPHIGKALAERVPGAVALDSEADALATDSDVMAITSEERDGRFMVKSADWGDAPRWAGLADLYMLSSASTVVCAGQYAPSTFCELAAALAAVRVGLRSPRTLTGALWRSGRNASQFPALVWCPAHTREDLTGGVAGARRRRRKKWAAVPRCCETTLLG